MTGWIAWETAGSGAPLSATALRHARPGFRRDLEVTGHSEETVSSMA